MTDPFDDWLSGELEQRLRPAAIAPAPVARYSQVAGRRGPAMLVRGLVATTGAKLAVGGILAASAAGATGLAVTHHSTPPTPAPAPSISAAVDACKDAVRPASAGIGACVSASARHHGTDRKPGAESSPHVPASDGHEAGRSGDAGPAKGPDHDAAAPTAPPGSRGPGLDRRRDGGASPTPDSEHPSPGATPSPDHGSDPVPSGHPDEGGHR